MNSFRLLKTFTVLFVLGTGVLAQSQPTPVKRAVAHVEISEVTSAPIYRARILFRVGAALDPAGQEGLASLTAAMLAKGGSKKQSYEEIVTRLYPMSASFESQVDKEMTLFTAASHLETLKDYWVLITEMLTQPGFREDDFKRLKEDAINYLKVSLSNGNDEELGKEHLYNIIYRAHPYGHHNQGTVRSLEKITLADVNAFYRRYYTAANLTVAASVPRGLPVDFSPSVVSLADALPKSEMIPALRIPQPQLRQGIEIDILQRETRSTGISIGFPISVKRGDPDYPALLVASYYFGQHRSSNSHLYQQLREARGLNYGDYSYIEYFPRGMFLFQPEPNLARQQQIFQIWIRPVQPEHGHFALRAALFEWDKLVKNGLSKEDFEATKMFLTKFAGILTQTTDANLGYQLDSRYYGTPSFVDYIAETMKKLSLAQVNAAIKRHLGSKASRIVVVTKDAEGLQKSIIANTPSPITYNSAKPEEILVEDKLIEHYPIIVDSSRVRILPAAQAFE
ncbi:MAG: insulinase family protein [Pedosphaera sp.]|nr:insulinase family protein [Pedosphaera sp.]